MLNEIPTELQEHQMSSKNTVNKWNLCFLSPMKRTMYTKIQAHCQGKVLSAGVIHNKQHVLGKLLICKAVAYNVQVEGFFTFTGLEFTPPWPP